MGLWVNPEIVYRMVLIKNHKALRRAVSQQQKGHCVQPFLTRKETFLMAIFFLLEKQCFLFPPYSLRRQLAMMIGFWKGQWNHVRS